MKEGERKQCPFRVEVHTERKKTMSFRGEVHTKRKRKKSSQISPWIKSQIISPNEY